MFYSSLNRIEEYQLPLLEEWAKYSLLAALFFLPISTTFGELFYLFAIVAYIGAGRWKLKLDSLLANPLTYIFWLCAGVVLLGLVRTQAPVHISFHIAYKYAWLFFTPILMTMVTEYDDQWREYFIRAFLGAVVLTLFLSYLKVLHLIHIRPWYQDGTVFRDYIVQSFIMAMGLLIILPRAFQSRRFRGWYIFLAVAIIFNMMFLSYSRIGYIVFVILNFYTWYKFYRWNRFYIPMGIFLITLLTAFYASPFFMSRANEMMFFMKNYKNDSAMNNSFSIRLKEDHLALHLLKHNSVLGFGTGSIKPVFDTILPPAEKSTVLQLLDSAYMNIFFQYGLMGLLVFFFSACYLWKFSQTVMYENQYVLQGLIVILFFGSFINDWFTGTTPAHLISVFFVIFASTFKKNQIEM